MLVFYKVILLITLYIGSFTVAQKDPDEDSPYEFGFTIDGQQHRHEKKDDRGIIQGEFGFITADGIYHVTVYATDENGSFKILSMRNLRISAPLDGSPFKGEISPEANKYRKQANLQPLPEPSPNPLSLTEVFRERITSTVKPDRVKFTTQPTIKPGCASCGYVTTRKPEAGQRAGPPLIRNGAEDKSVGPHPAGGIESISQQPDFPTNIPAISDHREISRTEQRIPANGPIQSRLPQNGLPPYQTSAGPQNTKYDTFGDIQSSRGQFDLDKISAGPQNAFDDGRSPQRKTDQNVVGMGNPQISGLDENVADRLDLHSSSVGNDPSRIDDVGDAGVNGNVARIAEENGKFGENNVSNAGEVGINGTNGGIADENVNGNADAVVSENTPAEIGSALSGDKNPAGLSQLYDRDRSDNPEPNPLQLGGQSPVSTLPPIAVSDGVIHVGGDRKQDIPIKDKYPGMEDGLPAGVNEKDITDLLYKFHYTVGFHGHYEKGLKNGAKIGGYFVNGRDGISRVVTYIADENGYRPKVKFINLGLESEDTPKAETEKTFGLKSFEFEWYPI